LNADMEATSACLTALGDGMKRLEDGVLVTPLRGRVSGRPLLDCGESGSTLRFLLPVVCALGAEGRLILRGRLPERPLSPLWEELERHGAVLRRPVPDAVAFSGRLEPGEYSIPGDVSSQYISGLLFALPLLAGESRLIPTGKLESAGYVEMTKEAQALFGLRWSGDRAGEAWRLAADRRYRSPGKAAVEGDWSNAAFWLAADALSPQKIRLSGLDPDSPQGDRAAAELIPRIRRGNAVIDLGNVPDLAPPLAAVAAVSPRETRFVNAGRLRLKESDRLRSICAMLTALGADAEERPEELIIRGRETLRGGTVDSCRDHRIAMSAAVAALACREPVTILGAEAVEKSYPGFWADYRCLGGRIREEKE
ncbi:MAG: 3-phosphoshikimate 1-carboxyvinyltransferase, partial [Oscillospiraceae bacterium]|nr:3-phosphoshikimate 1-carboxyvinyltransferase [Oscillospiraceae bacterium]